MLLLSLVTDTIGLMKSLYFSKDNTVLLTFPATPSLIFFSKLATYYVYELRKSFMFTIPMFIAYGIAKGFSFFYYPWLILMFVLISVIPILIAALLSIPAMFAQVFFNRVKAFQYILFTRTSTSLRPGAIPIGKFKPSSHSTLRPLLRFTLSPSLSLVKRSVYQMSFFIPELS